MDDPQIWTMISAFVTVMIGGFGLMIWMVKAEVRGVKSELGAEIKGLAAVTEARFADVDHRFETLETDMHLIKAHLIGPRSA